MDVFSRLQERWIDPKLAPKPSCHCVPALNFAPPSSPSFAPLPKKLEPILPQALSAVSLWSQPSLPPEPVDSCFHFYFFRHQFRSKPCHWALFFVLGLGTHILLHLVLWGLYQPGWSTSPTAMWLPLSQPNWWLWKQWCLHCRMQLGSWEINDWGMASLFFSSKKWNKTKIEKLECAVENNRKQCCREFLVDYKYYTGTVLGLSGFFRGSWFRRYLNQRGDPFSTLPFQHTHTHTHHKHIYTTHVLTHSCT